MGRSFFASDVCLLYYSCTNICQVSSSLTPDKLMLFICIDLTQNSGKIVKELREQVRVKGVITTVFLLVQQKVSSE